jgi:hypothetical protein
MRRLLVFWVSAVSGPLTDILILVVATTRGRFAVFQLLGEVIGDAQF